jgi:hypothetical protein
LESCCSRDSRSFVDADEADFGQMRRKLHDRLDGDDVSRAVIHRVRRHADVERDILDLRCDRAGQPRDARVGFFDAV